MSRPRTVLLVLATAAVTSVLTSVGVVAAGGGFTDVGPTHPFRAEIDAIVAAGITTGYEDGSYRPGANVTRGAMAAFMERGFGRAELSEDVAFQELEVMNGTSPELATEVFIDSGAAGTGSSGYVTAVGTATLYADVTGGGCPCAVEAWLQDSLTGQTSRRSYGTIAFASDEFGNAAVDLTAVLMVPSAAGARTNIELIVRRVDANGPTIAVDSSVLATYVPFDGSPGGPA